MTECRTLTPADFIDRKFCDWFIMSKAKRGQNVRYACKTCSRISRTKTCLAFADSHGETYDKERQ